jgi:hypothetical protein
MIAILTKRGERSEKRGENFQFHIITDNLVI